MRTSFHDFGRVTTHIAKFLQVLDLVKDKQLSFFMSFIFTVKNKYLMLENLL